MVPVYRNVEMNEPEQIWVALPSGRNGVKLMESAS